MDMQVLMKVESLPDSIRKYLYQLTILLYNFFCVVSESVPVT